MKVLITGAKGQLGYQLQKVFANWEILATDTDTMDITDKEQVRKVMTDSRPDLIINGAAYTNVDGAEEDKKLAFKINSEGAGNVAVIAKEIGAYLVQISTDFVFDGKKGSPYTEDDCPNPLSVYGESKYEGEKAVQEAGGEYLIARTAWLYGENGKNFVETMLKLADEKPELTVVDDQIGSPTYTADLARVIKELVDKKATGIFHTVNTGQASWYEFAREIMKLAGKNVPVKPMKSAQLNRPAKRPSYSVLDTAKLRSQGIEMRAWQEALAEYIKNRN